MISPSLPFEPASINKQESRPVQGLTHSDSVFALERVPFRQPIVVRELAKNIPLEVNFTNKLDFDCLIKGITLDIPEDDTNLVEEGTARPDRISVQVVIQTLDKDTRYVLNTLTIYLSSYPAYYNELTLSPKYLYRFRTSKDVKAITFSCMPLYQNDPIVFYPVPSP